MKKDVKKIIKSNKKPLVIGAIGAGVAVLAVGLGKAFKSMKASAKAKERTEEANARYEAAKKN